MQQTLLGFYFSGSSLLVAQWLRVNIKTFNHFCRCSYTLHGWHGSHQILKTTVYQKKCWAQAFKEGFFTPKENLSVSAIQGLDHHQRFLKTFLTSGDRLSTEWLIKSLAYAGQSVLFPELYNITQAGPEILQQQDEYLKTNLTDMSLDSGGKKTGKLCQFQDVILRIAYQISMYEVYYDYKMNLWS